MAEKVEIGRIEENFRRLAERGLDSLVPGEVVPIKNRKAMVYEGRDEKNRLVFYGIAILGGIIVKKINQERVDVTEKGLHFRDSVDDETSFISDKDSGYEERRKKLETCGLMGK